MPKFQESLGHIEKMHGPAKPKEVSRMPEYLWKYAKPTVELLSDAAFQYHVDKTKENYETSSSSEEFRNRYDELGSKKYAEFFAPFRTKELKKGLTEQIENEEFAGEVRSTEAEKRIDLEMAREQEQTDNRIASTALSRMSILAKDPKTANYEIYKKEQEKIYQDAASKLQTAYTISEFQQKTKLQSEITEHQFNQPSIQNPRRKQTDAEIDNYIRDVTESFQDQGDMSATSLIDYVNLLYSNVPVTKARNAAARMLGQIEDENVAKEVIQNFSKKHPDFFTSAAKKKIQSDIEALKLAKIQNEKGIINKIIDSLKFWKHDKGEPALTTQPLPPAVQKDENFLLNNSQNYKSPENIAEEAATNLENHNLLTSISKTKITDFNDDFVKSTKKAEIRIDLPPVTPPLFDGANFDMSGFAETWNLRIPAFNEVRTTYFNNTEEFINPLSKGERNQILNTYSAMNPLQRSELFDTMYSGIKNNMPGINSNYTSAIIENTLNDKSAGTFARFKSSGLNNADGDFAKYQAGMLKNPKDLGLAENTALRQLQIQTKGNIDDSIINDYAKRIAANSYESNSSISEAMNGYGYVNKGMSSIEYITPDRKTSDKLDNIIANTRVKDPFTKQMTTIANILQKYPADIINSDHGSFFVMVAKDDNQYIQGDADFLMSDEYNALILRP